jgi:hypothetical protein
VGVGKWLNNHRLEYIAKREGKRLGLKVEKAFFEPKYKMEARMFGERGLFFFGDWSEATEDEVKAISLNQLGRYVASHRVMLKFNLLLGAVLIALGSYFRQYLGGFLNYLLILLLVILLYLIFMGNLEGYLADVYACGQMNRELYYNSLDSLRQKMEKDQREPYGGWFLRIKKIVTSLGPWLARRR